MFINMTPTNTITILSLLILSLLPSTDQLPQQTTTPLIPSFPTIQSPPSTSNFTCHLDLSPELFAGVSSACSSLDRHRCCPVLAAWLFAAHAHSALSLISSPNSDFNTSSLPISPDDSQKCVDSFRSSLASRSINLPSPNSTCDTVLCFCGIRLHHIQSLSCPAAFPLPSNLTAASNNVTAVNATAAVHQLERDCRNSSYAGCTRCLQSLQKIKGGIPAEEEMTDRAVKMFNRDCQLMGLTWLLAKNRTAYIPTVSAVIRAVLYSSHLPTQPYRCSPDQENMPLAVDSLQIQKLDSSAATMVGPAHWSIFAVFGVVVVLSLCFGGVVVL